MQGNSGNGKSKNNNHNPALRDHEREKGHSGEAIIGSKKVDATPSRKPSRTGANVH
jgi:hypothetical protein